MVRAHMATEGTRFRDVQVCCKSTEIKQGAVMSASAKEWVCVCMAWQGGALWKEEILFVICFTCTWH